MKRVLVLLRYDSGLGVLPLLWVAALFMGGSLGLEANERLAAGQNPTPVPDLEWALGYSLLAVVIFLAFHLNRIAPRMWRHLPVSFRELWTARFVSSLISFGGSVLVGFLAFALVFRGSLVPAHLALAINTLGLVLMVPVFYQAGGVRELEGAWQVVPIIGLVAASFGFAEMGMETMLPGALILTGLVILCAVTYVRLPAGWEIPPATRPGGRRSTEVHIEPNPPGFDSGWGREVVLLEQAMRPASMPGFRETTTLLTVVLMLAAIAFSRSQGAMVFMVVVLQVGWFGRRLAGCGQLDHLPLPRGRLFAQATLPGFLIPAAALSAMAVFQGVDSLQGMVPVIPAMVYVVALHLGLSLAILTTSTSPAAGGRGRHQLLGEPRFWAAAAFASYFVFFEINRWTTGTTDSFGEAFRNLAAFIPFGPRFSWGLVVVFSALAIIDLQKSFSRAELAGVGRDRNMK